MITFNGRSIDRRTVGDVVARSEAGRVEHVGARFLVGLQARDRIGEIGAPDEKIFGAGGQREGKSEGAGGFRGRPNTIRRVFALVQRRVGTSGGILDRTAHDTRGGGAPDRLGHRLREHRRTRFRDPR